MVEDIEQCFSHLRCHRCCRWSECWYVSIALPEALGISTMCICSVMTGYFLADHFIAAAHNMNMVPGAAPASSMGATGLAIGLVLLALLFVLTAFLAYRIAGKGPDYDEEPLLNSDSADASVMA